jgi:hypothetical protein
MAEGKESSTAGIAILVALATAIGALISPALQYFGHEHEMNVKMVELGVGILRTEATKDGAVMRNWAIDTIERATSRKFSDQERASLLNQALPVVTQSFLIPPHVISPEEQKAVDAVVQQRIDNFLKNKGAPPQPK